MAKRGIAGLARRIQPLAQNIHDYFFAEMDYAPRGWGGQSSNGWDDRAIAEAQAKHWPTLARNVEGTGPLGVAHFPWCLGREDRIHHNIMMSYGYVLARAARNKDAISILDWGGGVGHYCLYSKALLPEVKFDYHCFDVPPMCEVGRKLLPEAHFYSEEAALEGKTFDLVISSSSLHYFENWREAAQKLAAASHDFLYVARLQTVFSAPSFVAVQHADRKPYGDLRGWCLNQGELVSCLSDAGMQLLREFVYAKSWAVRGAPEKAETRGFLFRRR
ncbi:MAG TPA: methyltransferase domain-containing protein [Tepidisphaeraceae bacterium]